MIVRLSIRYLHYHRVIMSFKDAKFNFLVDIAADLFMSRSVQDVTIKDLAISAQVGEATIYRYFGTKQAIVIQVAMKLQSIVSADFFKLEEGRSGYEKLAIFYQSYFDIFNKYPNFYKFLDEFDAFISVDNADATNPYESAIDEYRVFFMQAYELGVKDGSIKPQEDIEMFYFSTTHALLELCKKLANQKAVISQDKRIGRREEIQYLIDIILKSLKNL